MVVSLRKRLYEEEEMRKKAEEQLETKGAKLERARAELMTAQTELAQLKETFAKHLEDALIEVSRLQARAKDEERKVIGVAGEIVGAKIVALSKYQSLAEFKTVCADNYDKCV